MKETPLRKGEARRNPADSDTDSQEISCARSRDRLEIYLTPKGELQYTLRRLIGRLLRLLRAGADRSADVCVRVYFRAQQKTLRSDRIGTLHELRSAGPRELLMGAGVAICTLRLGILMQNLMPGSYALYLLTSNRAGMEVISRQARFEIDCPNQDWVLPSAPVSLAAGCRFRIALEYADGGLRERVYECQAIHVGNEPAAVRQSHILGRKGTRMLDLAFAFGAAVILCVPFAGVVLCVRHQILRRYPEVAAARAGTASGRVMRFLAPALCRDESRWVWWNGQLGPAPIYRIETLTPDGRPLLGRLSLLMHNWGVDEWPRIYAIFQGGWSLFGPRAVPNGDNSPGSKGGAVLHSRDLMARYLVNGEARKPGLLSSELALPSAGPGERIPWRSILLYDRYDSTHWSVWHALCVAGRLALSFLWGEAIEEPPGLVETRVVRVERLPGNLGRCQTDSAGE